MSLRRILFHRGQFIIYLIYFFLKGLRRCSTRWCGKVGASISSLFSLASFVQSCFSGGRNVSVHVGPGHQHCTLIDNGVCLPVFWSQVELPGKWCRSDTEQGRAGWGQRTEEEAGEMWTSSESVWDCGHLEPSLCKGPKHVGHGSLFDHKAKPSSTHLLIHTLTPPFPYWPIHSSIQLNSTGRLTSSHWLYRDKGETGKLGYSTPKARERGWEHPEVATTDVVSAVRIREGSPQ